MGKKIYYENSFALNSIFFVCLLFIYLKLIYFL